MKTAYIGFRAGGELEEELKARTPPKQSLGLTAKRDLGRYYQLLRDQAALCPPSGRTE